MPNPFLFMSGYTDAAKSDFQQVLPYYTAIGGVTTDAALVQDLRSQGKLFLYQTVATPTKTVAQLVADWSVPFQNTLGGALPGGFDAIQIDEFGAYADGSAEATKYATALQQLRAAYPDKRIFVWSTWSVADGGPNTLYGNPATTYSTLLNAINNYADRYMLECYLDEANNQLSLFAPLSNNIESFAPGLRAKTVFGIYIPQSGFVADDSTNVGYWGYLDAQLHTIRTSPTMSTMPGAAFWVAYRSEKLTWDYAGRLVNHYFTQNLTSYFGDGSFTQSIANPQFESNTTGWTLTPGTGGSIARVSYSSEGVTPTYHDDYGYATHQSYGLRMVRGSTADTASYTVSVTAGMTYTVSAFVKAAGASSGANRAKLSITKTDGTQIAAKEAQDAPLSVVGGPWKRIIYSFTVPAGQTSVKVVLGDTSVPAGTTLYWDFVEMEAAYLAGDGLSPTLASAAFSISPSQSLALQFSEDVAPTFTKSDVQLLDVLTGNSVATGSMNLSYPGGTSPATITFPGLAGAALPDGYYRLTLQPGSVADISGSVLMSAFNYEFFVGTGGSGSDTYHLQRDLAGTTLQVIRNGGTPFNVPLANLSLVAISSAGGDDVLQLDVSNGLPWSAGGIVYDLGAQSTRDTLQLIGTSGNDTVSVAASQLSLSCPVGAATLPFAGAEAIVFDAQGGDDTMTINAVTAASLAFHGSTGNNTLNINAGAYALDEDALLTSDNLTLNVAGGTVAINATQHLAHLTISTGAVTMSAAGNRLLRTDSLDISLGATLNLNDNSLIVAYDSLSPIGTWVSGTYTGITGMIRQGRNGGTWDGSQIITSMTAARLPGMLTTIGVAEASVALPFGDSQTALWQGETVDATTVLVGYTYAGDANLDRAINGDDYFLIDAGFSSSASGYFNGDFDYNGRIDVDDYFVIDSHYNKSATALAPVAAPSLSYVGGSVMIFADLPSAYEKLTESDDFLM